LRHKWIHILSISNLPPGHASKVVREKKGCLAEKRKKKRGIYSDARDAPRSNFSARRGDYVLCQRRANRTFTFRSHKAIDHALLFFAVIQDRDTYARKSPAIYLESNSPYRSRKSEAKSEIANAERNGCIHYDPIGIIPFHNGNLDKHGKAEAARILKTLYETRHIVRPLRLLAIRMDSIRLSGTQS